MRTTRRIGLLILSAAFALCGCGPKGEEPAVGTPAPPTRGTDADGASSSLTDYRGKVVMLDFWASW